MGTAAEPWPATVAAWMTRPVQELGVGQNALTVDVEDYFQVEALAARVSRADWDSRECRIEANIHRILRLCDAAKVKGTFFTLGWIAERYKSLVREIVSEGHELASHGYGHLRADRLTPEEFSADISTAKNLLEDISGKKVLGYRAPCFSISTGNLWALDVIRQAGYAYSSSIYPIRHDNYGLPSAPRYAFRPFADDDFVEIPVSSVRMFGANWPCGGGGYFRLLPLSWSLAALNQIDRHEKKACVFYFHPWEIDPDQPRVKELPFKSRVRHYSNLGRMEARITKLLHQLSWSRIDEIFPVAGATNA
jgi:polysaccharide deacetylase family protein (PEP-CTERM system associated)